LKPSPTPSWTPDQLRGIRTTGRSLLVSAAAGSGKTAVLAARCSHLVCDAEPPCEVHELLVVTFTEAAAAEMKGRIEKALRARLAGVREPDARLERQLAMVERASVSTLHGFCSKLIRQNFHLLGLDPSFQMLDGDEQQLLRTEVARAVFAQRHETDDAGHFARLIDVYAGGDDERLIPRILSTYEMLCSVIDPTAWIERALSRLSTAADINQTFEESELGAELAALVRSKLTTLQRRCGETARVIASYDGLSKYVDYVRNLNLLADDWTDLLENKGLDALSPQVLTVKLDRKPTIKGELPGKELAGALISDIQETFKKGDLHQLASFTIAEWRAGLQSILPGPSNPHLLNRKTLPTATGPGSIRIIKSQPLPIQPAGIIQLRPIQIEQTLHIHNHLHPLVLKYLISLLLNGVKIQLVLQTGTPPTLHRNPDKGLRVRMLITHQLRYIFFRRIRNCNHKFSLFYYNKLPT